jgi:prepilin-type N-terminal cleavage/methylation domain-containing protein
MASRQGFTLVELLVAIVLIDVGLLALVAASTVVLRQVQDQRARSAAVYAATDRIETLSSLPCAAAIGATAGPRGIHEHWQAVLLPSGAREIGDSVVYASSAGPRSVVLRTRNPC